MYSLKVGFIILQYLLLVYWGYWIIVFTFGFFKPTRYTEKEPKNRFLLLIPAHNEERVIKELLINLISIDYPKHLYDIHVIADNCCDQTSEICISMGINVINHISRPDEPRGKPYAIKYAIDYLGNDLTSYYEGVVILDADNLVSNNYLKEVNTYFEHGHQIIQCFIDAKNRTDNLLTIAYSSAFYYSNRYFQLAKSKIGLNSIIGGTGFCIHVNVLNTIGWNAHSLTEDLEFTIQSILKGYRITWCHTARIYDEKPTNFYASCIQRLRWARGHWDVTFHYSMKLFINSIRHCNFKSFDILMYLFVPISMLLNVIVSVLLIYNNIDNQSLIVSILPWYIWPCLLIHSFILLSFPLIKDANINKTSYLIKSYFSVVFLFISNIPLVFIGLISFRSRKWNRTEHSRNIAIQNINK